MHDDGLNTKKEEVRRKGMVFTDNSRAFYECLQLLPSVYYHELLIPSSPFNSIYGYLWYFNVVRGFPSFSRGYFDNIKFQP